MRLSFLVSSRKRFQIALDLGNGGVTSWPRKKTTSSHNLLLMLLIFFKYLTFVFVAFFIHIFGCFEFTYQCKRVDYSLVGLFTSLCRLTAGDDVRAEETYPFVTVYEAACLKTSAMDLWGMFRGHFRVTIMKGNGTENAAPIFMLFNVLWTILQWLLKPFLKWNNSQFLPRTSATRNCFPLFFLVANPYEPASNDSSGSNQQQKNALCHSYWSFIRRVRYSDSSQG